MLKISQWNKSFLNSYVFHITLKMLLVMVILSSSMLYLNKDNEPKAIAAEVPWEYIAFYGNPSTYTSYDHANYYYRLVISCNGCNIIGRTQSGSVTYENSVSGFLTINIPAGTHSFGLSSYSSVGTLALERQPKSPPLGYYASSVWSIEYAATSPTQWTGYDHSRYFYKLEVMCNSCTASFLNVNNSSMYEERFDYYGYHSLNIPAGAYRAGLASYSDKYAYAIVKKRKNTSPILDISQTLDNQILAADIGLNKYKILGFVRDSESDSITITAEIAGVTRSTIVHNTAVSKPFVIDFDVITDQIPNGIHQVNVTANDGQGGTVTKHLSISVRTRAVNNLYITIDDHIYYETIYDDLELDIQKSERWKFIHDQDFFENPIGLIPDHNAWRTEPYTQFPKTGHFKITVQAMDTLSQIPEYEKWSRDSFDILNLYVHRKPVPQFTIAVFRNISGGFPSFIVDSSYDLDKQSLDNGIADSEWSWKDSTATAWTSGQPPINLTVNRSYNVKLRVKDHQGLWSTPLIKTFSTVGAPLLTNIPPVATVTIPAGTQDNPTVFAIQKPTFTWTQTDTDAATVFKSFEIQVTNEANTATVFSSGTVTQNTTATTKSWTTNSDLPAGVKLRVRVRVNDGLSWSDWSAQTWLIINRPPEASFDWLPKPVWEGDTVTITNQSIDADGDALSYSWDIRGPGNYQYTSTTNHISRRLLQPGDYVVTLIVSDGKAQSIATRSIRVEELGLTANVSYTDLWLEHHLLMGHETIQNPKSFYTGEVFIVSAVGSLAATNRVTASLDAIGRDGNPISIAVDLEVTHPVNHFLGSLYDPILSSLTGGLPEGPYQIKFKIAYTNGIMKEVNIPIQIIGHVQSAVNVHRRQ